MEIYEILPGYINVHKMHLTHLIVTRGIIHVYTSAMRMLCRCNASAEKNFRGSASGAILILWCAGIIMQRKAKKRNHEFYG